MSLRSKDIVKQDGIVNIVKVPKIVVSSQPSNLRQNVTTSNQQKSNKLKV
jgi:hypothetical protein